MARIHVSSPAVPPAVMNSVYMNIPKHPEYVNFTDTKHQYVNVSTESQSSHRRKSLYLYFLVNICHHTRHHSTIFIYFIVLILIPRYSRAAAKASSCQTLLPDSQRRGGREGDQDQRAGQAASSSTEAAVLAVLPNPLGVLGIFSILLATLRSLQSQPGLPQPFLQEVQPVQQFLRLRLLTAAEVLRCGGSHSHR